MKATEGSPYALDAEQAIVAALFGDRAVEMFDRLVLVVNADDFYFQAHASVFGAFAKMTDEGMQPDPATLSSRIKSSFKVDDDTRKVLVEAASYPYVPDNIETYGRLVAEKATARRVASGLTEIAKRAGLVGGGMSASDLLAEVEAIAQDEMREPENNQILQPIEVALGNTLDWMQRKADGLIAGTELGIRALDEFLGGVEETDLMVIAARPSMGKTALALCIARHIGLSEGAPLVPIFSLEMGENQLMLRFLANFATVSHDRLRRGALTEEDYDRLGVAIGQFRETNIRVDCGGELKPSVLRSKLRMLVRREKKRLGAILVDYIQLMDPDRQSQNKATEVGDISKMLKRIAKEFKAPVIALSQLNRGVEQRPNKRPTMADLRESGAIEQDADIIAMLYRDEYYNPDSDQRGIAEIIITKNRNGNVGTVPASFVGEYQRFTDASFYMNHGNN